MDLITQESPRIRSFVRRQGRMTVAQQTALDQYWEKYGLNPAESIDLNAEFGRDAPLIMEIGFGNGMALAETAAQNPQNNYLGIEVHRPGVGHLLLQLQQNNLNNVRVFCHDAIDILEQHVPDSSLSGVHLFFPDPWHKKRHHKRRIVRPDFIRLLEKKLAPRGYFHAATDWENYAETMLALLSQSRVLVNFSETQTYCPRPEYRPLTKFEQRGIRLGHGVWDLIFARPL
jgi:tRNA (guanine-N7-)-methyltransferase